MSRSAPSNSFLGAAAPRIFEISSHLRSSESCSALRSRRIQCASESGFHRVNCNCWSTKEEASSQLPFWERPLTFAVTSEISGGLEQLVSKREDYGANYGGKGSPLVAPPPNSPPPSPGHPKVTSIMLTRRDRGVQKSLASRIFPK